MVKLIKNEWKRYRIFSLVMLLAAVGMALILALLVVVTLNISEKKDSLSDIASYGNFAMVCIIISALPGAAVIYCILSYAADIGRKGMIFLTPVSTWKIISSKLIYAAATFLLLYAVSFGGILLASAISNMIGSDPDCKEMTEMIRKFAVGRYLSFREIENFPLEALMKFILSFLSTMHMSILVIASISLARFAANSVGIQVLLSIVFYFIVALIERLIDMLIAMLMNNENIWRSMFEYSLGNTVWSMLSLAVYSVILYIVCACLTDKKVNLVS